MSDTKPSIPRGHFVASSSGLIDRPGFDWPFDREADKAAFMLEAQKSAGQRKAERRESREAEHVASIEEKQRREAGRIDAAIAEALDLREMGCADTYICRKVGIARQTLTKYLGPPKRKTTQKLPAHEREAKKLEAAQLREAGWSNASIGMKLGVSKQAVAAWFKSDKRLAA